MQRSPRPHHIADLSPTLAYFVLAAVTIFLGLILRFIPVGLPYAITKYGGSALWAVMVYFLLAALMPHRKPILIAPLAITFATLLEFSRLYHAPSLDAFRLSLAGALLLGRVFEPAHLVAYALAIVAVALIDNFAIGALLRNRPVKLKYLQS